MRTARGRRPATAACVLAVLTAPLAIAAGHGGAGSSAEPGDPGPVGHFMLSAIPGEIDNRPQGFVSSDVLRPLVNAWRTSSHRHLTEVDAGGDPRDRSAGLFAIFRHDFRRVEQKVTLVRVKDAGPLRITRAPLGRRIQVSAQLNGEIDFVGAGGLRGTLHLSDDTVTLRKR